MRTFRPTLIAVAVIGAVAASLLAGPSIPAHPKDLEYPPLDFKVPPADQFREVLSNGMVVYIAEDRLLPTFDLSIIIRTGAAFEPPDKAGLASLMGEQLRDGGTQSLAPAELDEKVEFLAAGLSTFVGDTQGGARLSCLVKDVDEALALLLDVLRYPRFDEERFRQAKDRILQNIKRRNDDTGNIEELEWNFLMYGQDHFVTRHPSSKSINAVTREDLAAFHARFIHPGNMMVAVAGDFDRAAMLGKLEKVFGSWPIGEPAPKTFDPPRHEPAPGVYLIQKADVNQGRVSLGHRSTMRGSPDEFALQMMDGILGGIGFKSRIVKHVRSEEGLAYSAGSSFAQGTYWPEDFRCYFQSKSDACPYAIRLVLDDVERMRTEKISQEELDHAVAYFVESFPQRFGSKMAVLGTYMTDEYTGRDSAYWQSYVDNLKKVTPDDVLRVAKEYLHPDKLVILAVGDADAIRAGGHDKNPDLKLDAFGAVQRMEPRDPDTLRR